MTEPSPESLTWRQTGKLESQLVAGGDLVGTLRWEKGRGTRATGESTEGSWTFTRVGFLTPKIVAHASGSKTSSATLTMKWRGGGMIEIPTGQSFRFAPKGFWRSEWSLTDPDQKRLLTIRPNFAWGTVGASVDVEPAAQSIHELPLLTILCWYTILLLSNDNPDGAVVASLVATGTI
jgi:hypothetical protein